MKLVTRRVRPEDFAACWSLVLHRSRFTNAERRKIERAWEVLLPREAMRGATISDIDRPQERLIAFGASVFVRRAWLEQMKKTPVPFYAVRGLLDFDAITSPVLYEHEIGRDNAGPGLNLMTVHHGWTNNGVVGLSAAGTELVTAFQNESVKKSGVGFASCCKIRDPAKVRRTDRVASQLEPNVFREDFRLDVASMP
jgi:hypothetical protein